MSGQTSVGQICKRYLDMERKGRGDVKRNEVEGTTLTGQLYDILT